MTPFNHGFNTPFGVVDTVGVYGFMKCLSEVMNYLEEETQFKPEKRFIDAVPLIEKIASTNKELSGLITQAQFKDELSNVELEKVG